MFFSFSFFSSSAAVWSALIVVDVFCHFIFVAPLTYSGRLDCSTLAFPAINLIMAT